VDRYCIEEKKHLWKGTPSKKRKTSTPIHARIWTLITNKKEGREGIGKGGKGVRKGKRIDASFSGHYRGGGLLKGKEERQEVLKKNLIRDKGKSLGLGFS